MIPWLAKHYADTMWLLLLVTVAGAYAFDSCEWAGLAIGFAATSLALAVHFYAVSQAKRRAKR